MKTIYIKIPGEETISSPITEEIQIEAVSEFSDFASLVPTIDTLITLGTAYQASGGTIGGGTLNLRSIMDAPRWTKTLPTKVQADLHFFVKTDPIKDVAIPMSKLLGLHVLREDDKNPGQFYIPGISMRNASKIRKDISGTSPSVASEKSAFEKKDAENLNELLKNTTDAVFSLLIPGIVYLPYAYIASITPTYSNQETESKIPIWARATIMFSSIGPAQVRHFTDAAVFAEKMSLEELEEWNIG